MKHQLYTRCPITCYSTIDKYGYLNKGGIIANLIILEERWRKRLTLTKPDL